MSPGPHTINGMHDVRILIQYFGRDALDAGDLAVDLDDGAHAGHGHVHDGYLLRQIRKVC